MKHKERLLASLNNKDIDRPPVALWRHFPVDDMRGSSLAAAHLAFQARYDFDILKVTPSSGYFVYDWGARDIWRGNPEGVRTYTQRVIQQASDWQKLHRLDPSTGHLGEMLAGLKKIRSGLGPNTPMLMTVFSPLANAKKLAGHDLLQASMGNHEQALHDGLAILAQTSIAFIIACKRAGIDGVFFAVQHAQKSLCSPKQYEEYGRPYDLQVLSACKDLYFNMLHLHGQEVYFKQLANYPVQAINWHDLEAGPDLKAAQLEFDGMVCGGLNQWETMVLGDANTVRQEAAAALALTEGRRFMLGTGCVTPVTAPYGNLLAARRAVEE